MSDEPTFVDTHVLVYAYDADAGHIAASELEEQHHLSFWDSLINRLRPPLRGTPPSSTAGS